jgi:hypothetical protein
VSRVIVSPGHMKRVIDALADNLQKYEQKYGPVKMVGGDDQAFH